MELYYVGASSAVIVALFLVQVLTKRFDPFAPVWLFLVGFVQVYVVQAITRHDWAIDIRGAELVTEANLRSFWALLWFLVVYHCGLAKPLSSILPRPPAGWSLGTVNALSPLLVVWGLVCGGMMIRAGQANADEPLGEEMIFRSFPYVMLIGGILLLVSARAGGQFRPAYLYAGFAVCGFFTFLWMFNGKRSLSVMGVLATTCAFYISKRSRPSWAVLFTTAFLGALAVTIAIGWRNDRDHDRSFSGFAEFLTGIRPDSILKNINIDLEDEGGGQYISYETEEYGGFLLMMDTVPLKSEYDYGANYLRIVSTFIPRLIWVDKPLYGREAWIKAWIAGSELERDMTFTGPAIGILGATQLNGGAWGTLIVIGVMSLLVRTAYEYLQKYPDSPFVQVFWSVTYINAWFMVVGDDPMNWFYYNWGYTTMPIMIILWVVNKFSAPLVPSLSAAPA
ncbi:hypothetical protein ACYOEI_04470 [Singulisphaera rosea]